MVPEAIAWPAGIPAACPACRAALDVDDGEASCPSCRSTYLRLDGIWRMLTPEAADRLAPFIDDYRAIRQAEGRGGDDDRWFRRLPEVDPDDRFRDEWRFRATSFRSFIRDVLEPMERRLGRPLAVLDLGAGLGWVSNHLSERGHEVVGVDLSDDARDGLGAWPRYATRWSPVQAEFDRLPFTDASVDLVLFDASLHYSTDIGATLEEALRVLRPAGSVAIVDTPIYIDPESGRRMLIERAAAFERDYGRRSDVLAVEGFLTRQRLDDLALRLGISWSSSMPWHGVRWALRPWRARIRGHREPARFPILVATRAP